MKIGQKVHILNVKGLWKIVSISHLDGSVGLECHGKFRIVEPKLIRELEIHRGISRKVWNREREFWSKVFPVKRLGQSQEIRKSA